MLWVMSAASARPGSEEHRRSKVELMLTIWLLPRVDETVVVPSEVAPRCIDLRQPEVEACEADVTAWYCALPSGTLPMPEPASNEEVQAVRLRHVLHRPHEVAG
jgi:hypothetical protein